MPCPACAPAAALAGSGVRRWQGAARCCKMRHGTRCVHACTCNLHYIRGGMRRPTMPLIQSRPSPSGLVAGSGGKGGRPSQLRKLHHGLGLLPVPVWLLPAPGGHDGRQLVVLCVVIVWSRGRGVTWATRGWGFTAPPGHPSSRSIPSSRCPGFSNRHCGLFLCRALVSPSSRSLLKPTGLPCCGCRRIARRCAETRACGCSYMRR